MKKITRERLNAHNACVDSNETLKNGDACDAVLWETNGRRVSLAFSGDIHCCTRIMRGRETETLLFRIYRDGFAVTKLYLMRNARSRWLRLKVYTDLPKKKNYDGREWISR